MSVSDNGPSKDPAGKDVPLRETLERAAAAAETPARAAPERTREPPWRRSRRAAGSKATAFAGDVAIAELRTKLALAPDRLPEPPPPSLGKSRLMWAGRITGLAVVIAVGVVGYRWGSNGRFLPSPNVNRTSPLPDRSGAGPDAAGGMTVMNAVPAVYPPPSRTAPPPSGGRTFRQLMVGAVSAQQVDAAARLAISATDAGANASVVLTGLTPGATLSAGRPMPPNSWRLSVDELNGIAVTPPRGFAGVMEINVELHLADGNVADRKSLRLEWLSRNATARTPSRQHDAAEIAQMVTKGAELIRNGDIAAARLMYQRAAEAGDPSAAFALAETYDPHVLAQSGIAPDIALAQTWYTRARDLGSTLAPDRLDRLARSPEQK